MAKHRQPPTQHNQTEHTETKANNKMRFLIADKPLFVPLERPQILAADLEEEELAQVASYIVLRPWELPQALSDQFCALWITGTPTTPLHLAVDMGSDIGPWLFDIRPDWLSVLDGEVDACECIGQPCEHSQLTTAWDANPKLRNWPDDIPNPLTVTELTAENSEAWLAGLTQ